ncbi:Stress response protein nst1 [Cytospora mali]|uniref:Stress response protein nst1 n=1 Tax=Cytospora mali TaxID=578113 RepID=A0A194VLY0_CYTMA|nr:Stress response protein nst1 [Valsa mali]
MRLNLAGGGSGLPPGKYDVFIIPDHSAGSGFLYLPSLRTNTNSFIAGFASALLVVVLGQTFAPAFQAWWTNFQGMGNAGMALLVVAVGLGAWSLGRLTSDSSGRGPSGWGGGGFYSGGSSMPGAGTGGFAGAGPSPHGAHPGSPPPNAGPPPGAHSPPPPKPDNGAYQRPPEPPPKTQQAKPKPQPDTSKNTWEKARDEVRKKEEERKAKEAEERRRAEAAQRLKELREKEARERAQREAERARREQEAKEKAAKEQEARDREAREKEAKERKEKELREAREKELRERLARDREERRKRVEAERKRKEEEAARKRKEEEAEKKRKEEEAEKKRKEEEEASQTRKSSTYAYSGVGERMSPWPNGKPPSVVPTPPPSAKKPPPPTATSVGGDDADAYSYRPYDQPKKPARRPSNSDLSESSWAPSQSTAHTSPPPSFRGGYSTKDPDKIVIKAVYSFVNQYAKTPASQLISGLGTVTDGLILRITTEGLFIDDDVRGVAQREWDVKAWTLKTVETGDWKAKGLHLLRATVRDQEGKRYLFIIGEEEGWKLAVGLQRLRRGTQARALGVSSMSGIETKTTLDLLGWG